MSELDAVVKAIWEAECIPPVIDGDLQGWQQSVARAAISALDAYRAEEKRKNCKHPRRIGGGAVGESGSYSYWLCQDCGASYDSRTLSPSHRASDVEGV